MNFYLVARGIDGSDSQEYLHMDKNGNYVWNSWFVTNFLRADDRLIWSYEYSSINETAIKHGGYVLKNKCGADIGPE